MQIFNRPAIIDEAAKASMSPKKIEKGKKPGLNIILELLTLIALFFFTTIVEGVLYVIGGAVVNKIYEAQGDSAFFGAGYVNVDQMFSLIMTIIPTVLFSLYARLIQGRKLRTLGFTKKNAVPHYLIGLLVGGGMFSVAIGICALFGSVTLSAGSFSIPVIIVLFLCWMIQGNSEEIMCRGHMLVSFSRRYPTWVGVLLNSLLFACLHLMNPGIGVLPMINLFGFGIVMSLVFLRTGNIWMVSAIHTMWNFVQGNVFGVLVSGGEAGDTLLTCASDTSKSLINGGDFGLEGGLAVTAVLVITIVVLIFIKPCKGVDGVTN